MGILNILFGIGTFSRLPKPQPPYDSLSEKQRFGLYFLLDYYGYNATDSEWNYIKEDAYNYLEKATWYLGITKKQIQEFKPQYTNLEKIVEIVKTINNKQALEYMASNCYNLIILIEDFEKRKKIGNQFYDLWAELGYSYDNVRSLIYKYRYRTDI